jgi:hypothetical protein
MNKDITKIPLVLQYNKVDLGEQGVPLLGFETMEADLNSELKGPSFEASAVTGYNVVNTLKKAISLTMVSFKQELL